MKMSDKIGVTLAEPFIVAIDGPAGTGKSSVTKRLAQTLHLVHLDTGSLYRSLAFLWMSQNDAKEITDPARQNEVGEMAKSLRFHFKIEMDKNPSHRIYVNDVDLTEKIRTPQISMFASHVSSIAQVREALVGIQRQLGARGNCILEGRDIGTVIFPNADVKFFLTASIDERAKRRVAELEMLGKDVPSFEEIKTQMKTRDEQDQTRKIAPLKRAPDALEVDTTELTLDEVVAKLTERILAKSQARGVFLG